MPFVLARTLTTKNRKEASLTMHPRFVAELKEHRGEKLRWWRHDPRNLPLRTGRVTQTEPLRKLVCLPSFQRLPYLFAPFLGGGNVFFYHFLGHYFFGLITRCTESARHVQPCITFDGTVRHTRSCRMLNTSLPPTGGK